MTTTSKPQSGAVASSGGSAPTSKARSGRRRGAAALVGSILAGSLVAGAASFGTVAPAQADEPRHSTMIQRCDATACLYVWSVVDSDGDGVSDADELMAGTDPFDVSSTPGLHVLTDLLASRQLPSFEYGLATLVAMPAEIVELREKAVGEGRLEGLNFDGFPIKERGDALGRLGISADTMTKLGVDPARSGFTLGLDHASKDGALPPIRMGGIDLATISAGHSDSGSDHESDPDGGKDHEPTPPTPPPPPTPPTPPTTTDDLAPLTPLDHGGVVDKKPIVNGTMYIYKDGTQRAFQSTGGVEYAPDGGVVSSWSLDKKKYVNPDADSGGTTDVDQATFDAWERTVGTAERTIEGWEAPVTDDGAPPEKRSLVALYNGELGVATFVVFDSPRVTTAQPEYHPGLPDPGLAAGTGGSKGGTGGGCTDGFCS